MKRNCISFRAFKTFWDTSLCNIPLRKHFKGLKKQTGITQNCAEFASQLEEKFDPKNCFSENLVKQGSGRLSNIVTFGVWIIIRGCRSVDLGSQPRMFSLYVLVCFHGLGWSNASFLQLGWMIPLSTSCGGGLGRLSSLSQSWPSWAVSYQALQSRIKVFI